MFYTDSSICAIFCESIITAFPLCFASFIAEEDMRFDRLWYQVFRLVVHESAKLA